VTKFGLYIVQFFSILLLLCSYFLDVQSDKENDMHFNEHPLTSHYTIHKSFVTPAGTPANAEKNASISSEGKTTGKFNLGKHRSFESILPFSVFHPSYVSEVFVKHAAAIHPEYAYLFYKEINPPPPKLC